jgi:hypothetical protein
VHEDEHPQLLAFRPERVEFGIGQILAGNAAGNADAAEAELFDRVLDLLGGEVGELQCGGREGDETVRLRRADLSMWAMRSPTFDHSRPGASSG